MNLFQSYTSLVKSSGAGDKVFALLDRRPAAPGTGSLAVKSSEIEDVCPDQEERTQAEGRSVAESSGAGQKSDAHDSNCSIEINNVGFSYPTRPDNVVLNDFSLRVPQGKTVALVGASGRQQ
jgi:ABC-type multidrug transport system fused ATPase/permease subunit